MNWRDLIRRPIDRYHEGRAFEKEHWKSYFKRHYRDVITIIIMGIVLGFYVGEVKMCHDMGGIIPADENTLVLFLTCRVDVEDVQVQINWSEMLEAGT